jgi:hypothetical protein
MLAANALTVYHQTEGTQGGQKEQRRCTVGVSGRGWALAFLRRLSRWRCHFCGEPGLVTRWSNHDSAHGYSTIRARKSGRRQHRRGWRRPTDFLVSRFWNQLARDPTHPSRRQSIAKPPVRRDDNTCGVPFRPFRKHLVRGYRSWWSAGNDGIDHRHSSGLGRRDTIVSLRPVWGAEQRPPASLAVRRHKVATTQGPDAGQNTLNVEHNAILADPAAPDNVYTGADIGVWHSADRGLTWEPLENGLPDSPVYDLLIRPTQRLLRAATHGRGIYELALT